MLGVCISVDALEVDLRFPLHPLIEECIRWWRISPSQVALNSWRYLVVFLGECRGAGIIPTRDLFMVCFRLCKSQGDYYLTARVGFRVSGAPSNNKEPVEEPETPVDFAEEDASPVFHRPRSMKDLFKTKQEIDTLKSGGGPEAVAAAEKRASELEKELEKTKCERDEAIQ
ncbi:hypothetical protein BHM03_00036502 [Ensete ventricosum]|nr:hypothetical protein BHM03_00036502 [Ensete ventricosum]